MKIRILILILLVLTSPFSLSWADTGIPFVGWITSHNSEEASLFILPDGSGPPLAQAQLFGGQDVDAHIELGLVDIYFNPIPAFPYQDIWLDPENDTGASCFGNGHVGFMSDSDTNVDGETSFSGPLSGGGWSENQVWVYLNGNRATDPGQLVFPPVPLRFNSADINADGQVGLADVSLFAENFFGEYHYRSDFWWDGVIDLSDLGRLASSLGGSCD